jgi:hypothetical protein
MGESGWSPGDLVGRNDELAQLQAAVAAARTGFGGLSLIAGEPGIGKSRLVEQVAQLAGGLQVEWGRCWEAGGAPAYWPWIQVLRPLLRGQQGAELIATTGAGAHRLAEILPETVDSAPGQAGPRLEPEQARFQLMDAIATVIVEAARRRPLLVILEDLHVADLASVRLLDFLTGQIRSAPVLVIATLREADARQSGVGPQLAKLVRAATVVRLTNLTRDEVEALIAREAGEAPTSETVDLLFRVTEGNPLYLVEIIRLLRSRGGLTSAGSEQFVIPETVKAAIEERLAGISVAARDLLQVASVLGRELRLDELASLAELTTNELEPLLAEGLDTAIVESWSPGSVRFTHMLTREVIHQSLSSHRRQSLHLLQAERLEQRLDSARPPWPELAHHLSEAGFEANERALNASVHAAEQATAQLAFADAACHYQRALSLLDQGLGDEPDRRGKLLLELSRATIRAGEIDRGRNQCLEAAQVARSIDDSRLLARAALAYGSVFVYAEVDQGLLSLLREALDRLDASEIGLRARVLARLAAAMQPALDPQEPIALARGAIAAARQLGDGPTLLRTIRAGCSALMDIADPAERIVLNQEHVELARSLDEPIEELRGHMRVVIDAVELADLATADQAIAACDRIAAATSHPHYQWPVAGFKAMRAIMSGRFSEADELMDLARGLGSRACDPNTERTLFLQRLALLRAQESFAELEELAAEIEGTFSGIALSEMYARTMIGSHLARMEKAEKQPREVINEVLSLGDISAMWALAETCATGADRELAQLLYDRLASRDGHWVHWGLLGISCEGPVSRLLGLLAEVTGEHQASDRHLVEALAQARSVAARPMVARILYEQARSLIRRGKPAGSLLDEAEELATRLGQSGLLQLIGKRRDELAAPADDTAAQPRQAPRGVPSVVYLTLQRDGELWSCACEGEVFRLKDIKGVRMLARLVESPGQEIHALELTGSELADAVTDIGDAGAMIDATAREQYRQRVSELRAELEEAEAFNDPGRSDRAHEELDFITAELSRAFGLGGRERRSGAAAERARVNVQRRLRDAIRRVDKLCPAAGRHLSWAVRTGTYCCYDPS